MNVENLQKLYEVGARILRERLPIGFGQFDCGSFACFLGYYWRETGYRESPEYYVPAYDCMAAHFGITRKQTEQLFAEKSFLRHGFTSPDPTDFPSRAADAELERRMEYLAGLIREAGGTVPTDKPNSTKTHDHIPDSVRQIFAERVT